MAQRIASSSYLSCLFKYGSGNEKISGYIFPHLITGFFDAWRVEKYRALFQYILSQQYLQVFFQLFPKFTDVVMLAFKKRQHGSAGIAYQKCSI